MADEPSEYRKALLERNSAIKTRYNDAAQNRQPKQTKEDGLDEARSSSEAEPEVNQRPTSFAKSVELSSYQKNALDRQQAIKKKYNEASLDRPVQEAKQISAGDQGGAEAGSYQVKNKASQPHLRPTGPGRTAVDAQIHQQDMNKDDAAVSRRQSLLERNERIKRANNAQDGVNLNKDGNSKD